MGKEFESSAPLTSAGVRFFWLVLVAAIGSVLVSEVNGEGAEPGGTEVYSSKAPKPELSFESDLPAIGSEHLFPHALLPDAGSEPTPLKGSAANIGNPRQPVRKRDCAQINVHSATSISEQETVGSCKLINGRFVDNGDGTVTDAKTSLMWMRCAVGQEWDGESCLGYGAIFDWPTALEMASMYTFAGHKDWRLPSVDELGRLVVCSSGQNRRRLRGENGRTMKVDDRSKDGRCLGEYQIPTVDSEAFPNTSLYYVWSASALAGTDNHVWLIFFSNGREFWFSSQLEIMILLVRSVR